MCVDTDLSAPLELTKLNKSQDKHAVCYQQQFSTCFFIQGYYSAADHQVAPHKGRDVQLPLNMTADFEEISEGAKWAKSPKCIHTEVRRGLVDMQRTAGLRKPAESEPGWLPEDLVDRAKGRIVFFSSRAPSSLNSISLLFLSRSSSSPFSGPSHHSRLMAPQSLTLPRGCSILILRTASDSRPEPRRGGGFRNDLRPARLAQENFLQGDTKADGSSPEHQRGGKPAGGLEAEACERRGGGAGGDISHRSSVCGRV